jgi:hypothetical protein
MTLRASIGHSERAEVHRFRKIACWFFFRLNEMLWKCLRARTTRLSPVRAYGNGLHAIARMRLNRTFYFGTFFLHN